MDINKAKRLLAKINVLVDNFEGDSTHLELDLLRNYTAELLTLFGGQKKEQASNQIIPPPPPTILKTESKPTFDQPKYEPSPKYDSPEETPPMIDMDHLKKDALPDPSVPSDQPPIEKNPTPNIQEVVSQSLDASMQNEESTTNDDFLDPTPKIETAPAASNGHEPHPTTSAPAKSHSVNTATGDISPELQELFVIQQGDDLQSRLSDKPLPKIEMGMGINEQIFTKNELFGGDDTLYKSTLTALNEMSSFDDAKSYLIEHVAQVQNWSEASKKKKAIHFIKIVRRKYTA